LYYFPSLGIKLILLSEAGGSAGKITENSCPISLSRNTAHVGCVAYPARKWRCRREVRDRCNSHITNESEAIEQQKSQLRCTFNPKLVILTKIFFAYLSQK